MLRSLLPVVAVLGAALAVLFNPTARIMTAASSTVLQTSGVNVALASNGATATASSMYSGSYSASGAIDGDRKGLNWGNGGGWNDGTAGAYPDWLQVDFAGSRTITEIDVFSVQDNVATADPTLTMTFSMYGITDFSVQYWDGTNWTTVSGGSVTGNDKVWRRFTFGAVTTTKIRVNITSALASSSRIVEVEAWTPSHPPTVGLTSPGNGAAFMTVNPITLEASATDADGTIAKVEFLQGSTVLGQTTTSPYGFVWSNVASGSYSLTARATDDSDAVTTSSAVSITVSAPAGWIAGQVTRSNSSTAIAGASISISQSGGVLFGATTNSSGEYSIPIPTSGSYTVQASAAGYGNQTQTGVAVAGGATTTANFRLEEAINYVYDELGRLISVINKDGNAATYSYDAVGNLLSISRQVPTTVSIIQFSPSGGAVGSTVTIYGSGYSANASQNSVTFNGVSATVSASSTNVIVTTVPSGATTGSIVVTSPTGSATSSSSFTVGSSTAGTPTITSFSPTVGAAGTSVTISGTNFNSTSANDRATVNVSQATIGSASSTSISTTIPSATASGRISVATPVGKVVSSADFFVPPPSFSASDIEYTGRMSIGGTSTLTISTATKIGLMLFDGTSNQRVALSYSSNTIALGAMTLISPNGAIIYAPGSGNFFTSGFVEPLRLPMTGTYTILVDPENSNTGSMPITLYDVPADVSGSITIGGSGVSVATTVPGQNGSLSFSASAGQKVSLSVASSTLGLADIYIRDSWGANAGSRVISTGADFMDTITLPSTGNYTVKIDPRTVLTGGLTLTLNNTNDVTGTITAGGSSVGVTLSVPGRSGVLTFSGTSGQRVSLGGASATFGEYSIAINKPDGSALTSNSGFLGSSPFLDPQTLPSTGTYSIVVNPQGTNTGSITLTLYDVPADAGSSISIGGSAVTVTTTVPGQNGQLTFSGTSGQQVTVHITSSTLGNFPVSLLKPDGTTLTSANSFWNTSFDLATQTLPSTGTYTIRIDPSGATTGTLNVTVTSP